MTKHDDIALRKAAIFAGFGSLVIFISGILANFFILQNRIVPKETATTVNNIMSNELQFSLCILSFIIMVIFDVMVAWDFMF